MCNNSEELLTSEVFDTFFLKFMSDLKRKQSRLLNVFPEKQCDKEKTKLMLETLYYLNSLPAEKVMKLVDGSDVFFKDRLLFNEFVEQIYNSWRQLHRLIICDSVFDRLDKKPYRTFNETVENLMHLVRSTYRNIQENITGNHPKIYRQVSAGAEIGAIVLPKKKKVIIHGIDNDGNNHIPTISPAINSEPVKMIFHWLAALPKLYSSGKAGHLYARNTNPRILIILAIIPTVVLFIPTNGPSNTFMRNMITNMINSFFDNHKASFFFGKINSVIAIGIEMLTTAWKMVKAMDQIQFTLIHRP